jgi:hypothetical protein
MNSWFVWTAFVLVAVVLGLIAYFFSLRALRVAAAIVALATAAYLTWYGSTHPAKAPSLSGAFTQGTDALIRALFHLPSAPPGHHVSGPGWIDWLIVAVLLMIGYRELEALSQHCHARSIDTSDLTHAQQTDSSADGKDALTDGQGHDWLAAELKGALTDEQRRDRLADGLKFWLPAVEVRAPAILPGGSRSSALASIAEASGVNGSGLAGAIIRFFGMLWPNPRRVRVRVWVKGTAVPTRVDALARVAVALDDPGTGASLGTKTVAADSLDDAGCAAAGYVARRIFEGDPTAPPWCIGVADGGDLAAMLLARHERCYPETEDGIKASRDRRIGFLEKVAWSSQCAGVVRYDLAHLYDLTGHHAKALALHANNREQYPRFYRGRYRLAMSLEMIASSDPCTRIHEKERDAFDAALRILHRWDGTTAGESEKYCVEDGRLVLSVLLRAYLLEAARKELREIQRCLTLRDVIWTSFWHRNERGVLKPYWRLRHRQSFHDGVYIAQLLVTVRQTLNQKEEKEKKKLLLAVAQPLNKADKEEYARLTNVNQLPHARKVLRIATTIACDSSYIAGLLDTQGKRWGRKIQSGPKQRSMVKRRRIRRWPRQYSTPSWPAAYNLACVYAAIYAHLNHQLEDNPAEDDREKTKQKLTCFVEKVVTSLEFAITNPECEMERPWEWIANDPDFGCLHRFSEFSSFLDAQRQRDYPLSMTWTANFWPGPRYHSGRRVR